MPNLYHRLCCQYRDWLLFLTSNTYVFWAMKERERKDVLKWVVQLHVRSCGHPLSSIKRTASGPLTTHQVSAQSVQPFTRHGKGDTSARAQVRKRTCTPVNFYKTPN